MTAATLSGSVIYTTSQRTRKVTDQEAHKPNTGSWLQSIIGWKKLTSTEKKTEKCILNSSTHFLPNLPALDSSNSFLTVHNDSEQHLLSPHQVVCWAWGIHRWRQSQPSKNYTDTDARFRTYSSRLALHFLHFTPQPSTHINEAEVSQSSVTITMCDAGGCYRVLFLSLGVARWTDVMPHWCFPLKFEKHWSLWEPRRQRD